MISTKALKNAQPFSALSAKQFTQADLQVLKCVKGLHVWMTLVSLKSFYMNYFCKFYTSVLIAEKKENSDGK